jgi:hypothetical protein
VNLLHPGTAPRRRPRLPISVLAAAIAISIGAATAGAGSASAAHATPPDDSATDSPVPVGEAQAGLARILDAHRPADLQTTTTLDGCPIIERKAFEGGLHEGGFEDRLPAWGTEIRWDEYEQLNPAMVGVTCLGDSDGNVDDDAIGTLAGVLAVDLVSPVTFPDLAAWGMPSGEFSGSTPVAGGELVSECVAEDPTFGCIAVWHSGGLAIGLMVLDDASSVDQSVVDNMLVDILPDVLYSLAQY